MSHGTIEPKTRIVARQSAGKTVVDGMHFQLGTRPKQKTPVICCTETGKFWLISWEQLVALAIADGINVADPEPSEGDSE